MSTPFKVIIPARFASTRLPGKPLRELAGKTMIEHVYACAGESGAGEVVIATDDGRIQAVAEDFGARVAMTRADHPSGTDRLAEVVDQLGWDDDAIVVNLQGDEPLMPPALVAQVAQDLAAHPQARIATPATPITAVGEFFDPNVVKVVTDREGFALYFSRAPVPWDRDACADGQRSLPTAAGSKAWRHIGLYAYRAGFLRAYARMEPSPLEDVERLEQLRALWNGERIHMVEAISHPGPGVDTEEDITIVEQLMLSREAPH